MSSSEIKFVDNDQAFNPWRDCRVYPAIGPKGQLVVRFADTSFKGWMDAKAGQSPITLSSGKPAIHPEFERIGFVLYEDLCAGQVPGVEASPKHWKIWKKYVELRAAGREPAPGSIKDSDFYHPEVLRRRENADIGGLAVMKADELARYLGFDDPAAELFADDGDSDPKKAAPKRGKGG